MKQQIGRLALILTIILGCPASAGDLADHRAVELLWVVPDGEVITDGEIARAVLTESGRQVLVININQADRNMDQVLRHEMAHFEAWRRYGTDIEMHGPEFREVCREFVTRRPSHFCRGD